VKHFQKISAPQFIFLWKSFCIYSFENLSFSYKWSKVLYPWSRIQDLKLNATCCTWHPRGSGCNQVVLKKKMCLHKAV